MSRSERQKMAAGDWYTCLDPELDSLRQAARLAVHQHNSMSPTDRGNMAPLLADLLDGATDKSFIEAPFHCAYGLNITLGAGVYLNAGCTILDTAAVTIGDGTMLGPAVQIYCADHHRDPAKRRAGMERAAPVTLGTNVWIGGGTIILPGLTIGDDAIVGAGAVVTRSVSPGQTVVGNPGRQV